MGYFLSITKIEEKAQKFKPAIVQAMHYQWQEKKRYPCKFEVGFN